MKIRHAIVMKAAALPLFLGLSAGAREIVTDIILPAASPAESSTVTYFMQAPGDGYALYSDACPATEGAATEYRRGEHWVYHGNERLSEEICWTSSPGAPAMTIRAVRRGRLGSPRQVHKSNFTLQREISQER